MSKRTTYRNGDSIDLACGCNGCNPARINGVLCHEHGCPDAWRDYAAECVHCGCDFYRQDRHQTVCNDCTEGDTPYFTDCTECGREMTWADGGFDTGVCDECEHEGDSDECTQAPQ
jgi:hypothetical protein